MDKNPNQNALWRMIGSPNFTYLHRVPDKDGLEHSGPRPKKLQTWAILLVESVFSGTQWVYTRV